jgi:hypothetical protein
MRSPGFLAACALLMPSLLFAGESRDPAAWPQPVALVSFRLDGGRAVTAILDETMAQSDDVADYNKALGELLHRDGVTMSPEFLIYITNPPDQYARAVGRPTRYYATAAAVPASVAAPRAWVELLYKLDGLSATDQAKLSPPEKDRLAAYDACLNVGRADGKTSGCGDVWQDGLDDSALACSEGKTYVRCQLDCKIKYRAPDLTYAPGPCAP